MTKKLCVITLLILLVLMSSCQQQQAFKGAKGEVKIMTLDPGHSLGDEPAITSRRASGGIPRCAILLDRLLGWRDRARY